jgi:dihydrodipicolinate synthase/N-acetylneuraminate lyase
VPSIPPKGLLTALITPLDAKGKIDWLSLKALIDRLLPFSDGFLIGEPLVGEGLSLPDALRLELFRGCLEAVKGRKPLFLCPTAQTSEETLKCVEAGEHFIRDIPENPPVFWVDLPLWHHSNRKLPQFYEDWNRRTSLPLLLYNHPALITRLNRSLKRKNIRTAVLKKLSENERIVGIVQAGDFQRTLHYQRAVRMRRDFRIYDGDETNFLNQPSSSGVVSWGANLLPTEWQEVVTGALTLTEDPGMGLSLFKASQKLKTLSKIMHLNPAAFLKYGLYRTGQVKEARLWKENLNLSSAELEKMESFLRENFSLQTS